MKPAPGATLFLDRDGTLNVDMMGTYVTTPRELKLLPGVAAALQTARDAGFQLVIITNQAGVAKGLYSADDLNKIHLHLESLIAHELSLPTFQFDLILTCPHLSTAGCACRKPKTGMLEEAQKKLPKLHVEHSFFIGDRETDIACGKSFGLRTILLKTGWGSNSAELAQKTDADPLHQPDHVTDSLAEAVDWVLAQP